MEARSKGPVLEKTEAPPARDMETRKSPEAVGTPPEITSSPLELL